MTGSFEDANRAAALSSATRCWYRPGLSPASRENTRWARPGDRWTSDATSRNDRRRVSPLSVANVVSRSLNSVPTATRLGGGGRPNLTNRVVLSVLFVAGLAESQRLQRFQAGGFQGRNQTGDQRDQYRQASCPGQNGQWQDDGPVLEVGSDGNHCGADRRAE